MTIEELSRKMDKYHREDKKRARKDRYENLGFLTLAFALAIISIAVKNVSTVDTIVYVLAAILLLVIATKAFRQWRKIKVE